MYYPISFHKKAITTLQIPWNTFHRNCSWNAVKDAFWYIFFKNGSGFLCFLYCWWRVFSIYWKFFSYYMNLIELNFKICTYFTFNFTSSIMAAVWNPAWRKLFNDIQNYQWEGVYSCYSCTNRHPIDARSSACFWSHPRFSVIFVSHWQSFHVFKHLGFIAFPITYNLLLTVPVKLAPIKTFHRRIFPPFVLSGINL